MAAFKMATMDAKGPNCHVSVAKNIPLGIL